MTPITNYTSYDLEYYYADLKRLPRLSREERQHLVTGMSGVPTSPAIFQDTQVKHQLIESYLPFAKHLAIALCPPSLYRRLLPELIGAVNLAVVEATMRCDLSSTLSLDTYVAAYVRGAIKRTLVTDDLLLIPSRARERAREEGTLENLSTLFYEYYRGYTIYSSERGWCCIHGPGRSGCLRLRGQFVSFPDIEDAKQMIKYFRTQGIMSWESMERSIPEGEYIYLNRSEQQRTPLLLLHPLQRVS